MNSRYLVYYERTADTTGKYCDWSGFCPDLPGCVSVGDSLEHMREMMREAMEGLIESMEEDGDAVPPPAITSIDFAGQSPEMEVAYTVVEWLEVYVPAYATLTVKQAALVSAIQEQAHHG